MFLIKQNSHGFPRSFNPPTSLASALHNTIRDLRVLKVAIQVPSYDF